MNRSQRSEQRNSVFKVLAIISLSGGFFLLLLAALSLVYPRLLGQVRLWNLNTGSYTDVVFLCGFRISEQHVNSDLESVFAEQVRTRQTGFPSVVIYSRSILQPARGGQWMRVAHLAGRFVQDTTNTAPIDYGRLLNLIHTQDDTELIRWYYERQQKMNGTHQP